MFTKAGIITDAFAIAKTDTSDCPDLNEVQDFTRLENLTCAYPEPPNRVINYFRQKLLDGEDLPLYVMHKPAGGFEVVSSSVERFYAYLHEDFEHIPVIVISRDRAS